MTHSTLAEGVVRRPRPKKPNPPATPHRGVIEGPDVVFVVASDENRQPVEPWLAELGYRVDIVRSLDGVSERVRSVAPRLVVADIGPSVFNMIHELRGWSPIPIVILDRDEQAYLAAVLEAGADDYVAKPPRREEFAARIRAVVRRSELRSRPNLPIVTPDFVLDLSARRATTHRGEVTLTPIEWRLVDILVSHPNEVVGQRELLAGTWGPGKEDHTNYLRVHMRAIRAKLEPGPGKPRYFQTESGSGVRFCPVMPAR